MLNKAELSYCFSLQKDGDKEATVNSSTYISHAIVSRHCYSITLSYEQQLVPTDDLFMLSFILAAVVQEQLLL